jgi:hypothetical protein
MISKLIKNAALAALAFATVGCNAPPDAVSYDEAHFRIGAAELPALDGCDRLSARQRDVKLVPVGGVENLYLVKIAGKDRCIDGLEGVSAMVARSRVAALGTRDLASSNPMPGIDTNEGEDESNPMPGDEASSEGSGEGEGNSNPMPGRDPINR